MADLLGTQHPFFRPLWRRVAVVALCLIWAVVELVAGSPLWAMLVGALGLYAGHQFLIVYKPPEDPKADQQEGPKP